MYIRDSRFRAIAYQTIVLAVVALAAIAIYRSTIAGLAARGIPLGFDFLDKPAGFVLEQSIIPFKATDTYGRALLVGLANTLLVSLASLVAATLFGFAIGAFLVSDHPILRGLARVYVETLRGVPLLLWLFFWYALLLYQLPPANQAWEIAPNVFASKDGVIFPSILWTYKLGGVALSVILGLVLGMLFTRRSKRRRWLPALSVLASLLIALAVFQPDLVFELPTKGRFRIAGGSRLTAEFLALFAGLSLSASAIIAEVVRAGILAVPTSQRDASMALGLNSWQTLVFVILPQASRLIAPPLASIYLSLVKSSSLALAIGYPDLVMVANTAMNQTGHAVECTAIYLATFLLISLLIALLMRNLERDLK